MLQFHLLLPLAILLTPALSAAEALVPTRYLDPAQPVASRVADLISRLTLEQKAALLNHRGTTVTVAGRPILSDQWNQCLSYTSFAYNNLKVTPARISSNGNVSVTLNITNAGSCVGDEVVQLYVHEMKPIVKRPSKELRGFARVTLQPGATRHLAFTVPAAKLAFWDETQHAFVVIPGRV